MPETNTFFNLLVPLFLAANDEMAGDDGSFFAHEDKRIHSFKNGLAELLIAADLHMARNANLRNSVSFRHFNSTQQIRESRGYLLGSNVGTSSEVIDAYCCKIRPTNEIARLIPDWSKKHLSRRK